jgi:hypothetical protein
MTISEALRTAILESGRSLNSLAGETTVDAPRLSRFVRGQRGLTLKGVDSLCAELGLELVPIRRPGAPAKVSRPKTKTANSKSRTTNASRT